MATKKPSTATQLKQAKADVVRLTAELDKANKDKTSAESMKDYYFSQNEKHEQEVNELHALLDAFEGALPRKSSDSYDAIQYKAMTRLASWLAKR